MPREEFGKRLPVDFRVIEGIRRSPSRLAEQGPGFMQDWGGPEMYQTLSRAPQEARVCYYAAVDGFTTPDSIEVATGLSSQEVSRGLSWLGRKGLITQEVI